MIRRYAECRLDLRSKTRNWTGGYDEDGIIDVAALSADAVVGATCAASDVGVNASDESRELRGTEESMGEAVAMAPWPEGIKEGMG